MTDYTATGKPLPGSRGLSKQVRDEFELIETAVNSKANIDSPILTGTPAAPTAAFGSSGTQIATLDFVNAVSMTSALPSQTGNSGKVVSTNGTTASWVDTFTIPWTFSSTATFNGTIALNGVTTLTKAINTSRATVASHATTADIWGATGNEIDFTGTATVTDFPDAPQAGASRVLHCAGACTFTDNSNISVPGGANYLATAGDIVTVHALTVSTFALEIVPTSRFVRQVPIFDSSTISRVPISSFEDLSANYDATGLAAANVQFVYKGSTWVAFAPGGTNANVASSPDGATWTLRAMPSNQSWAVGHDGTTFVGIDLGGTATATSTDGITWSSGGTAPAPAVFGSVVSNEPVSLTTGEFIAYRNTGTDYLRTTDTGATWTAQTLPVTNGGSCFFAVGSLYWYWASGTTAYTSATGATSSWTSRTLPATPLANTYIWQNPDGSLMFQAAANGTVYETSDGITWGAVTGLVGAPLTVRIVKIEGIYALFNGATSRTLHGSVDVTRTGTKSIVGYLQPRIVDDGNGLTLVCGASDVAIRIDSNLKGVFF